jgi:uncharacterized Fe-S center protein
MSAKVWYVPLKGSEDQIPREAVARGVDKLLGRLRPATEHVGHWGLKVQPGPPKRLPVVEPDWLQAVAGWLGRQGRQPRLTAFATLSITQEGLHNTDSLQELALNQGLDRSREGIPFLVADDPEYGESSWQDGRLRVAAGLQGMEGLVMLGVPRPHPHLGFQGAVAALGMGLTDRDTKLELHRDIRPKVDTPLCAGCGVCLAVCLFDAIIIQSGRAHIDHKKCTGCGECMTVCHMAGITPEQASSIPHFQRKVAGAARFAANAGPWAGPGRTLHLAFLLDLDRWQNRIASRRTRGLKNLGILASQDPVALDQACWDLLAEATGLGLAAWAGYQLEPGPLLEKAEAVGLGSRRHDLQELTA